MGREPLEEGALGKAVGTWMLVAGGSVGLYSAHICLAKIGGKGVAEVSYYWGLIYLYPLFIQKESKVGLTCHLQEN